MQLYKKNIIVLGQTFALTDIYEYGILNGFKIKKAAEDIMAGISHKWIIAFVLIAGILFALFCSQHLRRQFTANALTGLEQIQKADSGILADEDIAHMPEPVQKYLRYVGVVGKEKVKGFSVRIDGSMKPDREKGWAGVNVRQYSFTDKITRLFFIKMNMSGMPVIGLHAYSDGKATMRVKIAGLFPVVDGKGAEMNQGETVTVFNDMCLLAPATLVDDRIEWEPIDELTAKASFTNEGITISAVLYFNEEGQLINFMSDDRYYSPTGDTYERVRWSTPVSQYKNINGFNLPTYGEAIWNFPDGDFCYAKFYINDIQYNPSHFSQ